MPANGLAGITRKKVADLTAAGMKPRQIALALGISTQGVYYHLDILKGKGRT